MASSQRGAAPSTRDVAGELREHKRLIDILFRRLSNPPKAAAPVVSSGGIVGMAEVASSSGSVLFQSGDVAMNYADVTYGSPSDPNAGGDGEGSVAVSSWLTVTDGYRLVLSPGWYIPVLYMRVIWDNPSEVPPAFGGPYMNGGWDSVHNDYGIHAATPYAGGRAGFVQIANYGPTFVPDTSDLHAELRASGGNPTGDSNPAQSSIVWNITKLG